jgi:flagellar hook protein FlgE
MNSLSSIAQSGMGAAMLRLGAAANNIANVSTPGYRREAVQQQALPEGGVDSSIGRDAERGDDLAEDVVQQMIASYSFKANLRVIQTQNDITGSLLDLHA